jgi:glycosyltransferase involved in cell wall biosynthesis
MNDIGGIETACYQIAKTFKDEDITFVINATADGAEEAIKRLRKYHKVVLDRDRDMVHEADVTLIFTPIMLEVPFDTIKAKKIYHFVHSDIGGLMKYQEWQQFTWKPDPRVDKVVAVSDTVKRALKDKLGVDSEVVPNVFSAKDDRRVFLFMSRATKEKGLDKVLALADKFEKAGKDYVIIICSRVDPYGDLWPVIQNNKRIIYVPSSIYNDVLYRCADYLLQLSSIESYCYSIREALANGVAVLGSKIPEIEKVIKDGENGYLLDDDLSNLDIEKIFNKVPKIKGYSEPVPAIWDKVLGGKL